MLNPAPRGESPTRSLKSRLRQQVSSSQEQNMTPKNFTTGRLLVTQTMSCGSSIALKERISHGAPLAVLL